ncbi:hypothetical protein [Aminipila terrae]|uniref:Alanyl-tRNA synthetase class IIc N-terminal domain-containing protein n=1 Tax=Aminipila terrae TaxID=2697030 RepID=A0A6P1MKI5_9FIRM|nr:hypothetical protein [Aminipila terrae]QHI72548.1 hypothetical protein Ami3637_09190 [Aminipila terrae]
MNTNKLYQKNPYLKNCISNIVDVTQSGNLITLVLNQTIFFPTGGGRAVIKEKLTILRLWMYMKKLV